ncbi:MAG: hypothetical protein ACOVN6_00885 [Rhodoluna sp.]|jgi:hypothetical protein
MAKKATSLTAFLSLSFAAAAFVGVLVFGGTRRPVESLIWAGVTFIVVLVGIATLALTVKDDQPGPDETRLK